MILYSNDGKSLVLSGSRLVCIEDGDPMDDPDDIKEFLLEAINSGKAKGSTVIKEFLKQSMADEFNASTAYKYRAKVAGTLGFKKTQKLFDHIAAEEDGHYFEFNEKYDEIKDGGSDV